MAKLTTGQKAQRVLQFIMGLRQARTAEALAAFGHTQENLDEGFNLMREVTGARMAVTPPPKRDPSKLQQLDAWENRWFPVANASLLYRYPAVHAFLFLNLTQTEGVEVIVSVSTFLDRLARMASEPSLGPAGAEARALLTARGLSPGTVAIAEDLLRELGLTEPAQLPAPISAEAMAEAEAKMWAWYLEWGEIARVAIKDRRLLREMGFLSIKRSLAEEVEEEEGKEPAAEGDAVHPVSGE